MVVWNGTLAREGRCASLSSYQGGSQLASVIIPENTAKKVDSRYKRRVRHQISPQKVKAIKRYLEMRAHSWGMIAKKVLVSRWTVSRLAMEGGYKVTGVKESYRRRAGMA
jgi:hypothetical protein